MNPFKHKTPERTRSGLSGNARVVTSIIRTVARDASQRRAFKFAEYNRITSNVLCVL